MKVLFLDIDGVLNGREWDDEVMSGQIHTDKVFQLNRVLRQTGAKIVLSSAWRYIILRGEMDLMGMEWLLRSHGVLANRLIGLTRADMMERCVYKGEPGTWPHTNERGRQIADWLLANRPGEIAAYAVVDDIDLGISECGHPFVQTDGKLGLTMKDAENLIRLLNQ